ncbi:gamma-glutamyltransferase [Mobilicoccus pelagius]|uniref:Gamma-glutamyltranspeptidase n=1 Tax=Mobilicoccus pelagius NBRC 104925 TaxID=1089455 RepID=H5UMP7_9MICO|nr:gamma-glutamyltransferase [Mobilicoccus pelagius]GAB47005.1 gamma-glutamyltranspeptidase [Mobilicoccus pelagius NBRC 104925]
MTRRHVAVAGPDTEAVEAATAVVEAGGNAVDAAVAAVLVASITEVGIVSPMGGAFINVWAPGEEPVVLDGNVEMPGRGRPESWFGGGVREIRMGYYGGITVYGGHGSVATPGMFAALDEASLRWGSLPWAELVAPAADLARRGWPLGRASEYYLRYSGDNLFAWDPQTHEFMTQGGHDGPPRLGEIMRSPDLANSLDALARDGVRTLYGGELGRAVAEDMDAHGGLLSFEDLAAYRTAIRPVLRTDLGRWDVGVNPPPSIGGPVLTTLLRLLADRREKQGHTDAADVIEIQHTVLEYRRRAIDAADDLETAGRELIAALEEIGPEGLAALSSSPETIHVSAVDDTGLACAITTSAGYGSGLTTPGTGLMMNNALGEPELNRRGLHALRPGTRLASNMAPATARRDDGTVLAIGSPGADRITSALMQVIGGICLDGHPIQNAIDAPRVHVAFDDAGAPRVEYEPGPGLTEALARCPFPTVGHEGLAMYFGGVGAAMRHPDGHLEAAGDPRRAAATWVGPA